MLPALRGGASCTSPADACLLQAVHRLQTMVAARSCASLHLQVPWLSLQ